MKAITGCVALLVVVGCSIDSTAPVARPSTPASATSDAVHSGGTAGFYFLPPLVSAPAVTGTFDSDIAALNPVVVICDVNADADCGGATPAIMTFTSASSPAISVDPETGQYHVNWNTKAPGFDAGHTYRVHVRAGAVGSGRELGFADVLLTATPGQAKNASTSDVIVLNDGQTLPIKFLIGSGIAGSITVGVNPEEVRAGYDVTASATVRDLHGNPLVGAGVSWSSAGVPVAIATPAGTTGAGGVTATVVTAGSTTGAATITAATNGLSASAALTVVPAVIDQASLLASMNDPRDGVAVTAHGGLLYAIGGWTAYIGPKATNEVYDPASNQWSYRAPMPTARQYAGAAEVNGVIYVIGGHDGLGCCNTTAVVEAYDPATDTWVTKAPMLRPREQFAVAVHNGIIYAIGGWTPDCCAPFLATVEAYDPATNTWTPRASMPAPRTGHAVAVVNGRFYVVGGENNQTPGFFLAPALEYDPATDAWTTKAPIPQPRTRLGAAAWGGIVYAVGGWLRGNNGGVNTIEAYNPATDTWSARSPLNIPRWAVGVAALNGVVYAVGGVNQISDVPQLEGYRP